MIPLFKSTKLDPVKKEFVIFLSEYLLNVY